MAVLDRREFTVPVSSRCFLLMRPAEWDVDDLDDTAGADKPFVRGGADIVFVNAAALPSSAVAGYSMIQNLDVTSDDTLPVHGAAGSVGSATVQIAIDRGARVIGTASTLKHEYLRSLGAIPVLYGKELVDVLRGLGRITASADAVGGQESVTATRAVLGEGGRAVMAWGDEHSRAAGIPWVRHPDDELEQTVAIAARGALTVRIGETFPLARAADALRLSQTGHPAGKILLAP